MTRCGVAGRPIAHSLSPVLHRAAYAALDLDWRYDAFDLGVEDLHRFLATCGTDWVGLSLTMPLKETALALADTASDMARRVGAANTLVRDRVGGWHASNTDVPGLVAAWRAAGVTSVSTATVLGAGATARSAVAALGQLGLSRLQVLVRDVSRAGGVEALARTLGIDVSVSLLTGDPGRGDTGQMLVSTIPASAQPTIAEPLAARAGCVTDVVYDPSVTPLLAAAAAAGVPSVDGFALLLQQAGLQVELMTGRPAPLDAMRDAGASVLLARGNGGAA